jgi:hypothetical protein
MPELFLYTPGCIRKFISGMISYSMFQLANSLTSQCHAITKNGAS